MAARAGRVVKQAVRDVSNGCAIVVSPQQRGHNRRVWVTTRVAPPLVPALLHPGHELSNWLDRFAFLMPQLTSNYRSPRSELSWA